MNSENVLMIFIKNPVLGKVKTRLAKTIGDKNALEVYEDLLAYTFAVANSVPVDKAVFYSEHIINQDIWIKGDFQKHEQLGKNLGERMLNAFIVTFDMGYNNVIIIGSDCFELKPEIINNAFDQLKTKDIVIGPAKDGGYYLLGMNMLYEGLFNNKKWSSEKIKKII